MSRRLAIMFVSAVAAAVAIPTVAIPTVAARAATAPVIPPACIVVHGPSGLTIQVGYAPDGPATCHQVGG